MKTEGGPPRKENQPRWDGRRGWYEVWFATLNHRPSGTGLWLRYTLLVPADPDAGAEAIVWGFAFSPDGPRIAAKRPRPIAEAELGTDAIFRAGDDVFEEGRLRGGVTDHEGRHLHWDLRYEPDPRASSPMPRAFERLAPAFYSNPNLDVRFTGTVSVDGQTLELEGEEGGQSHIWGRRHAGMWAWAHLHVAPGFVIEALQARPQLPTGLGRRLPAQPFATLRMAGQQTSFRNVGLNRVRGRMSFPFWHLVCTSPEMRLHISMRSDPARFAQATYHDPSGDEAYCANTEVGDAVVEVYRRHGRLWRPVELHELPGRAHFEFGARTPFEGAPLMQ